MNREDSYKETREFICVGCGKIITLTKFASQKTCKCQDCKNNNIPINPDIVAQALAKNPPKQRKISHNSGNTKECACINCGNMVTVSKFMSASKVLCSDCRGDMPLSRTTKDTAPRLKPDITKLDKSRIMPISEYEMNDAVIANPRLRKVTCPACGHDYMKPNMIIDWSQFGMVVAYQCSKCYTIVDISEQARQIIPRYKPSQQFDYTGTEIKTLGLQWKDSSRLANAVCILIKICEEHNIDIDKILGDNFANTVPPYRDINDLPVPKGFVIPPRDKWVSAVQDAIDWLEANNDNMQKPLDIVDKLKKILKEENNEDINKG